MSVCLSALDKVEEASINPAGVDKVSGSHRFLAGFAIWSFCGMLDLTWSTRSWRQDPLVSVLCTRDDELRFDAARSHVDGEMFGNGLFEQVSECWGNPLRLSHS